MEETIMDLPEELLIEILAKLPVKSVFRFRCVCKHWDSIINSSEFAIKHYAARLELNRNDDTDNPEGYDRILSAYSPACSFSVTSYEHLAYETAFKLRPAVPCEPPKFGVSHRDIISRYSNYGRCNIYGPCNGVFLLDFKIRDGDMVWLLWNPAIRDVFRVPTLQGWVRDPYLGLGFDHVTSDFKVVCFDFRDLVEGRSRVYLYSLAANSWWHLAYLDDFNFEFGDQVFPDYPRYCCNGSKHNWMISYNTGTEPDARCFQSLFSFDMVDDVFVQTPVPDPDPDPESSPDGYYFMFVGEGSNNAYPTVCTTLKYGAHARVVGMRFWRLNEYGPTGSWTELKRLTVPQLVTAGSPMVIWKSSKAIVFANHQDAMSRYDLITKETTSLQFPVDNTILAYTESLFRVSKFIQPPPPPEQQQQQMMSSSAVQHEEEYASLEAECQRLLRERYASDNGDDDDDSSSTDSAFVVPLGPPVEDYTSVFVDYDADLKFFPYRRDEMRRLCELPYCLREVNQPIISNPCTF